MRPLRVEAARAASLMLLCAAGFGLLPVPAVATPYDNITVGDPIEDELRILDLFGQAPLPARIRLPHLGTRPLQWVELQGIGRPEETAAGTRWVSLTRIERGLGRDRSPGFAPHPTLNSTPRLFESSGEKAVLQVSAAAEGGVEWQEGDSRFRSGSGVHGRIALGLDRLVAYSNYVAGRFDSAQTFADPLVPDNDLIVLTEESYLSYTEEQGQWGAQYGINRWHWGPGQEGSLVLSKTAPAIPGLTFRAHHQALGANGIVLNATLEATAGEQLAAHRIEWQPTDAFRVGISEAARYQSPGWRPLYLIGVIPYVLVQRIEARAEPDSQAALRNNVVMSVDAAWRVADGTRIYGELLIDDLHTQNGTTPNKVGYQIGWEGAGLISGARVTWGGEWTRISRYVYTSSFGRDYEVQGAPLGFPTGPDVRRIRLRAGWDPNPDWTLFGVAVHNDKGENDISEPFVPGSDLSASQFEGIVEKTRELDLGARWWPASGVYVAVSAGYRWIDNVDHVSGRTHDTPLATIELRLVR